MMSTGVPEDNDLLRPLVLLGDSGKVIREMPSNCQDEIAIALQAAQKGELGYRVKALSGFGGASVHQISTRTRGSTFRVVYTVRFAEAVYVLHAFQKKSKSGRSTPAEEMDRVRRRLIQAEIDHAERYPESESV